jgi:hypothetical protein
MTNYLGVFGPNAMFQGATATKIADVTDGKSNTIHVVDVRQHCVHWMQPQDITESELIFDLHSAVDESQGNHRSGLQGLFADGSTRFLPSEIDLTLFHNLLTRNDGETITGEY